MPSEEAVLSEIDARGVAVVTLNRPAVNNAYNGALIDALLDTCARLADEPSLRVLVLRGAGRHFQAGADLAFLQELRQAAPQDNPCASGSSTRSFPPLNSPLPAPASSSTSCWPRRKRLQ